jgi:hypothetical protein
MRDAVPMTNFQGDAVKLEAEIILNRFRNAAELARLAHIAEQQEERAEEHGASRDDRQKRELQEIKRRGAETLESQCA